jgi:hypothetical protein
MRLESKVIFLFLFFAHSLYSEGGTVIEYISPRGLNKIIYQGDSMLGWGTFYKNSDETKNSMISVIVSMVLPKVKQCQQVKAYTGEEKRSKLRSEGR